MQQIFMGLSFTELFWGFMIYKLLMDIIIVIVCSGNTDEKNENVMVVKRILPDSFNKQVLAAFKVDFSPISQSPACS